MRWMRLFFLILTVYKFVICSPVPVYICDAYKHLSIFMWEYVYVCVCVNIEWECDCELTQKPTERHLNMFNRVYESVIESKV